jgi:hypothetical protein
MPGGGPARFQNPPALIRFPMNLGTSVQTESYRGIALSGFVPTPPSIISLAALCAPALSGSEQHCSLYGYRLWVRYRTDGKFEPRQKQVMVNYRAYTVSADEHFIGYEPMICADDGEAIERARSLVDGHDIELWSGPRLVIRISHNPMN